MKNISVRIEDDVILMLEKQLHVKNVSDFVRTAIHEKVQSTIQEELIARYKEMSNDSLEQSLVEESKNALSKILPAW